MSQAPEKAIRNARIVTHDEIIEGSLLIRGDRIAAIEPGASAVGEDYEGDYLIPGLVELHTDHLEAHYAPRPGVRWNATAALQAHDAQIAGSGITTVFDCLRLGSDENAGFAEGEMRAIADALEQAGKEGRLRAEHHIHLRCEVSSADVLEQFEGFEEDHQVRLVSLMDHAPGQRQFQTLDQYILYYKVKRGMSDDQFETFVAERQEASRKYSAKHRHAIAEFCNARGVTIASHDDATEEHVDEALGFGVRLAEFPTSIEAARKSHDAGLSVLMGAPNVVRGGSHSGNIAALDLAREKVLDVLSSDYVPFSLVHAPFMMADEAHMSLPEAVRLVTATPARTVGLDDRGKLEPELRADMVRVRHEGGVPIVRSVWRAGDRVA